MGYFGFPIMNDPRSCGHPQSRPHDYIPFVSRSWLEEFNVTEEDWHRWVVDHVSQFSHNNGMCKISDFILPESSELVKRAVRTFRQPLDVDGAGEVGNVAEEQNGGSSSSSGSKWPQQHLTAALASGHRWWESSNITEVTKEHYPILKVVKERELDILKFAGVQFPESEDKLSAG